MVRSLDKTHLQVWTQERALVAKMAIFLCLALLIPFMGFEQRVTGPLVNALLILAVESMGPGRAALVGMVSPLSAWTRGVLPAPLLVMVPFIMLGNAVFVTIYGALRRLNYWLALAVSAFLKFAVLAASVTYLTYSPLRIGLGDTVHSVSLGPPIIEMMRLPQLITALSGGVLAYLLMSGYRWGRKKFRKY